MNAETIMEYLKQKDIGMSVVHESLCIHAGTLDIPSEIMDEITEKTPELISLIKGLSEKEMKIEICFEGNNEALMKMVEQKLAPFWHELKSIRDLKVKTMKSVISPKVHHE